MTNSVKTTLYIGVTNDLIRRVKEHKDRLVKQSFTARYNLEFCVYFEEFPDIVTAIKREKELKKWSRQKKDTLINKMNPEWKELVTKNGFSPRFKTFSDEVKDLIKEIKKDLDRLD